jgi:hypothetical protein
MGTVAHKLPYHLAWDATSTSHSELSLRLGTTQIEVFAWESDGIPIWCKDEHGTPFSVKRCPNAELTFIYLRGNNAGNASYLHPKCRPLLTRRSTPGTEREERKDFLSS